MVTFTTTVLVAISVAIPLSLVEIPSAIGPAVGAGITDVAFIDVEVEVGSTDDEERVSLDVALADPDDEGMDSVEFAEADAAAIEVAEVDTEGRDVGSKGMNVDPEPDPEEVSLAGKVTLPVGDTSDAEVVIDTVSFETG